MQYYWEARRGEIFANGGPELIELGKWYPKTPYENNFMWVGCGFSPPEIHCSSFPE
jgi:hypothetical protein